jgi:hypothetical protein
MVGVGTGSKGWKPVQIAAVTTFAGMLAAGGIAGGIYIHKAHKDHHKTKDSGGVASGTVTHEDYHPGPYGQGGIDKPTPVKYSASPLLSSLIPTYTATKNQIQSLSPSPVADTDLDEQATSTLDESSPAVPTASLTTSSSTRIYTNQHNPTYNLNSTIHAKSLIDYFSTVSFSYALGPHSILLSPHVTNRTARQAASTSRNPKKIESSKALTKSGNRFMTPSLIFLDIPHVPQGPCEMKPSLNLISKAGTISFFSNQVISTDATCEYTISNTKNDSPNVSLMEGSFAVEMQKSTIKFWAGLDSPRNESASVTVTEFGTPNMIIHFKSPCEGWNEASLSLETKLCEFSSGM